MLITLTADLAAPGWVQDWREVYWAMRLAKCLVMPVVTVAPMVERAGVDRTAQTLQTVMVRGVGTRSLPREAPQRFCCGFCWRVCLLGVLITRDIEWTRSEK